MVISTSYEIENDKEFAAAIDKAITNVTDLPFHWKEIFRDLLKSNKTKYTLQNYGL